MKILFDQVSHECSRSVTKKYSTSFSMAVKMLAPSIRQSIYDIYGFVRFADEIVDTFHDYDKGQLLDEFEFAYYKAMERGISMNPVLNAFQATVRKYDIDDSLVKAFLASMRSDLHKSDYHTQDEIDAYIYGSADVVGLMCLKVFVDGDRIKYENLKSAAMRLGSAFQKVNFLRDLKDDYQVLNRSYFPNVDMGNLSVADKALIVAEIKEDFALAYKGIVQLPLEARFGVYTAYRYYLKLLKKLEATPSHKILDTRIRVSDVMKVNLLARSFVRYKLNIL